MTATNWIDVYVAELDRVGFTNSRQVCKWLLQHIMSSEVNDTSLCPSLSTSDREHFNTLHTRLVRGEPLQYVLGETEFYNCTIRVGPGVLIPRPETELLVDLALKQCSEKVAILDLCTGSGCIPLAIALERPEITRLVGVDISKDALRYAELNRQRLNVKSVEFLESDLYEAVKGELFGVITANPPYIGRDEYPALSDTVKCHEPALALFADSDGLSVLKRVVREAPLYLKPGGWLICEIGCGQGDAVRSEFENSGFCKVQLHNDFAGLNRIVIGQI